MVQIINQKKKINTKRKKEVVIKNTKKIEKKKEEDENIIIMVIRDIHMINIKTEKDTEIIEIIIVEVIVIPNIKIQNLVIVHHQNIISKDPHRIHHHILNRQIQKIIHTPVKKKKTPKKIIIIQYNKMLCQCFLIRIKKISFYHQCIQ